MDCYVFNKVNIKHKLNKIPYKILKGKTLNLFHLHVFSCECYDLNSVKRNLRNFAVKYYKEIRGRAYKIFNRRTLLA